MNDFVVSVKRIYPHLTYIRKDNKKFDAEVRSQILSKDLLKLGKVSTKSWEFPKGINTKQKRIWIRAFADCDGTVNDYNYTRYVAIDSINLNGLKQISLILYYFSFSEFPFFLTYTGLKVSASLVYK